METKIEKAIEWYDGLECYTPQAKDAKDVAIETMRKYQKIMNIVMNGDDTHYKLLMQIKEVIEDGKRKALEQEPQIRPKGHWLDTGWIHECSCCHERSFPFEPAGGGSAYTNFCPNCGADMRGTEE